jgi:hypothetical protein
MNETEDWNLCFLSSKNFILTHQFESILIFYLSEESVTIFLRIEYRDKNRKTTTEKIRIYLNL